MANKSIGELRQKIAAIEERLRIERREMKQALRKTPQLVKATLSSRKAMTIGFLAAAVAGTVWALRLRLKR
jgi:hypothetical protein